MMSQSDRGDRERWHGEAVTDEGTMRNRLLCVGRDDSARRRCLPFFAGGFRRQSGETPPLKTRKRSHPVIGTRAVCTLRGATQFQSGRAAPLKPRVAAGMPRLSPGPLVAPSLAGAKSVRPSQPGDKLQGPLSVRRQSGYSCAVMAVNADILPYFPQKVKGMWKT